MAIIRRKRRKSTAEMAAELAPPEEQSKASSQSSNNGGAIVVNTAKLNLPKNVAGKDGEENSKILGFEPVILFIIVGTLAFIAFIAYLISLEPAK